MSLLSSWESRRGCCRSGKSSFCKYAGHLLRCYAKINPQRIRSGTDATGSKLQQVFRQKNLSLDSVHGSTLSNMPAVNFCSRLVSVPPICKSAGKAGRLRCRFIKNSPRRIRSGTDAAGSKLQQVFRQKNLSLDSVHGRTLSNMPAGVFYTLLASALSISKRLFFTIYSTSTSSHWQKHTSLYIFWQRVSAVPRHRYCLRRAVSVLLPNILIVSKYP